MLLGLVYGIAGLLDLSNSAVVTINLGIYFVAVLFGVSMASWLGGYLIVKGRYPDNQK